MAIKEGRCINCGSILFLDTDMPQGHCFFCDCVFDNEEAFRANLHPEEFSFPNEPQPKYEGPSLTPSQVQRGPVVAAPVVQARREVVQDDYVPPQTKIPSLKIPMRAIALMVGVTFLVVAIFLAIAFPTTAKRSKRQDAIVDGFLKKLPYTVDQETDISIHEMGSTDVILVLPQDIEAEESIELFNLYCDVRADVMDLDKTSFKKTHQAVTFLVATPGGGFLIEEPADQAALTPSGLKVLD
ncbi:MAG: hypothetical protein GX849_05265 [Clostridiaceae bacterium]|nr:hypothetical protein [Clostridiaceae bacterium]